MGLCPATSRMKDSARMTLHRFSKVLLALAIGTAGGLVFYLIRFPLPWMLGALFASMAAAILGVPVLPPYRIRPATVAVIGVMLGARFTPEFIAMAGAWTASLGLLFIYMLVVSAVTVPYYRMVGKSDWQTAYLAGMPAGLTEMVELGEEKGADVRAIILAHTLRIVITVALIAVWFRWIEGRTVGSMPNFGQAPTSVQEAAILIGCAIVGTFLGKWLRFPAPAFMGPMALSAVLHATEVTTSAPPALIVIAAQIILGTVLGCRFIGVRPQVLASAAVLSAGSTVATLAIALIFALLIHSIIGVTTDQVILALAPGGLTEMGLIALAINADVAFVALHHVARILIVILLAKPVFALLPKR